MTVPTCPLSVMVLPLIDAGPAKMLKVTGKPEVAEAVTVKGPSVVNLFPIGLKLML